MSWDLLCGKENQCHPPRSRGYFVCYVWRLVSQQAVKLSKVQIGWIQQYTAGPGWEIFSALCINQEFLCGWYIPMFSHSNASSFYHVDCQKLMSPVELHSSYQENPIVCPIWRYRYYCCSIVMSCIEKKAAISWVGKFKMLVNINVRIALVQFKHFTTTPQN